MAYQIEFLKGAQIVHRVEDDSETARQARDRAMALLGTHTHASAFRIRSENGAVLSRWPDA